MIHTMRYPLSKKRIGLRNSKSGQYNTVMAFMRRLENGKACQSQTTKSK